MLGRLLGVELRVVKMGRTSVGESDAGSEHDRPPSEHSTPRRASKVPEPSGGGTTHSPSEADVVTGRSRGVKLFRAGRERSVPGFSSSECGVGGAGSGDEERSTESHALLFCHPAPLRPSDPDRSMLQSNLLTAPSTQQSPCFVGEHARDWPG